MALHYISDLRDDVSSIKLLIDMLRKKPDRISLDTETTGLDPFTAQLLLVQLGVSGEIFVINRGGVGAGFIKELVNIISTNNTKCVGHNIKFDIKVLKVDTGIWINNVYDTMIAESILTAGIGDKLYSLQKLVLKYCNVDMSKDVRLSFLDMKQGDSFTDQQIKYSANDLVYLFGIQDSQTEEINKCNMGKVLVLEMNLVPTVARMEYRGITLDVDHWNKLITDCETSIKDIAERLKSTIFKSIKISQYDNALELADALAIRDGAKTKRDRNALLGIVDAAVVEGWVRENLNLGSHKQLLQALNLAGVKTPDTNEKTLIKLPKNEIINTLLEYRDFEKRLSTYGSNIIDLINPVTGKIHTEYFQIGTQTGRFSSKNPNLQNVPVHNNYREGFVARDGYSFMAMDYSQQEYRLAGSLSKEPAIIEAYVSGFDMHTASAAKRYNKKFDEVTKDERSKGKGINFTVLYGGTEYALGKNLEVPTEEAKEILHNFFAGYPRLSAFKTLVENKIVAIGFSVTPYGRRRYFKPLGVFATPKEIDQHISKMKREGFNMVIQGGGADITKIALYELDRDNPFGDKFHPLLQVHDEIVAEVHDSILEEAEVYMRGKMEGAFQPFLGEIPAKVDCKISKRWTKS